MDESNGGPHRCAMAGFFFKPGNPVVRIDLRNAEVVSRGRVHLDSGDGDIRPVRLVPGQHVAIVHFVNMIGGEDQNFVGRFGQDALHVLMHCVRRPPVPVVADALHRRQDLDELPHFGGEDLPAVADMPV